MDCYYAAVEMRDTPNLHGRPVAVGGQPGRRGVLCTCNYAARRFGLHSAMPSLQALKLCPALVLLPPRMSVYRQISQQIRQIFKKYTDKIEPLSLDEAYLDVTECQLFSGSATLIAQAIRKEIVETQRLTASAGVAPNKFLAKVVSDWQKPDGLTVITPEQVADFVFKIPVKTILGVGKVTQKKLYALKLHTCGDLQKMERKFLDDHFGKFGETLYHFCRGIDHRHVVSDRQAKTVSVETTLEKDLKHVQQIVLVLRDLFQRLIQRLSTKSREPIKAQFIKLKFNNFTRASKTMASYELSFEHFCSLLKEAWRAHEHRPLRLIGIGVAFAASCDTPQQLLW